MDGTELQTPQAPATAPQTPQIPYPQFSQPEPQPTQQGGWTAWAQSQLGQMFQRQGPPQPTPSAPLIAKLSTPEGIERFVNAYNQEQGNPPRYDTGIPASGGSMDSLESAWSYLSQPNRPDHAAALLQQPPAFWRNFALAGGDWNPESGTVARSIR